MKKSDLEPNKKSTEAAIAVATKVFSKYSYKCKQDIMVVVDFTQPSYRKRLHIVEPSTGKVVRSHHVAQGSGSCDPNNLSMAVKFSNTPDSHCSSLGAMVTAEQYRGRHGTSLRLNGLEKNINDNVRRRCIVIHAADYVTDSYILDNGRAGRSQGCLAVDPAINKGLIEMITDGVFVYCYYVK